MKYLICGLNDSDYCEPSFHVCDTQKQALTYVVETFSSLMEEADSKMSHTFSEGIHRFDWEREGKFFVTEIHPFNEQKGENLLVWHHAYDGVGFKILFQADSYEKCLKERKANIREMFEENDFSDGDNEDFDIDTDNCIDTGNEWEIYSILTTCKKKYFKNAREIEIKKSIFKNYDDFKKIIEEKSKTIKKN